MASEVMSLFEEYVASYERGERPDLRVYLERAGEGRDELASLVDVWLQVAPAPQPDEESVEVMRAWIAGEPPLLELRTRRGVTRTKVVDFLMKQFSLDAKKRDKVERYYHEVETGQLAPSQRVREALQAIFGRPVPLWKAPPLAAEGAYFRSEALAVELPAREAPDEWDEVDELFRAR